MSVPRYQTCLVKPEGCSIQRLHCAQVFNEGWGQYDTERITKLAMSLDDTRLFDCASGWVDAPVSHQCFAESSSQLSQPQ